MDSIQSLPAIFSFPRHPSGWSRLEMRPRSSPWQHGGRKSSFSRIFFRLSRRRYYV